MDAPQGISDPAGGPQVAAEARTPTPQTIAGASLAIAIVANVLAVAIASVGAAPEGSVNPVGAAVAVLLCLVVAGKEVGFGTPIAALSLVATLFTSSAGMTSIAANQLPRLAPDAAHAQTVDAPPEPEPTPEPVIKPWL